MATSVPAVTLPFPGYKWRWMEFTPVETFNRLDVLLGVTRAIREFEGQSASSDGFNDRMQTIQSDLLPSGSPRLSTNDGQRNLLRRQGRYWRGLGILSESPTSNLQLTKLGRDFADGVATADDFLRIVVKQHRLPNTFIENDATVLKWQTAGLSVRPLATIIGVLTEIAKQAGPSSAYLTTRELHQVIVPIYLVNQAPAALAEFVISHRQDPAPFYSLPDCAPESNDVRMLREHLLFLLYGGLVKLTQTEDNYRDRFYLVEHDAELVVSSVIAALPADSSQEEDVAVDTLVIVQRARKTVEVIDRPGQTKFRRDVLQNCGNSCILTGETLKDVLIACHIHEVKDGGSDHVSNGVALRSDLHILFDSNKLRLDQNGNVTLSPDVQLSANYGQLPTQVILPGNLNATALRLRYEYGSVS